MRYVCLLLVLLITACVPAQTPPQLDFTPGAPIVVDGERYRSASFSVVIPPDWRVITSAADAPLSVIFVAPDDQSLIFIATEEIEQPPQLQLGDDALREATQQVAVGDDRLYIYGGSAAGEWGRTERVLTAVIESLATGQSIATR